MKLDDVPFIVRDMQKEMPIHTPKSAQVPHSYVRGMPKNLMDRSAEVDNKFLNNHLHEILEFYHCFPEYHSKGFEKYQLATYGKKYDILNHDGFFKGVGLHDATKHSMMIPSSYVTHPAAGGGGCTEGSEVTIGGTDSVTYTDDSLRFFEINLESNKCYDQLAQNRGSGANNINIGVYDDSSSEPNNLLAETGSFSWSNFDYENVTEFTTSAVLNYIGFILETDMFSGSGRRDENDSTQYHSYGLSFGSLPDPFNPSHSHFTSGVANMKITHS